MGQVFFMIIHGWPPTLPTPLKGMTEKWIIHILFLLRAKSEVLRTRGRVLCPLDRDANAIFHRNYTKK